MVTVKLLYRQTGLFCSCLCHLRTQDSADPTPGLTLCTDDPCCICYSQQGPLPICSPPVSWVIVSFLSPIWKVSRRRNINRHVRNINSFVGGIVSRFVNLNCGTVKIAHDPIRIGYNIIVILNREGHVIITGINPFMRVPNQTIDRGVHKWHPSR